MKKYIIVVSFLSLIAGLAIFYGSAQFLYHLTRKDLQAQAVQNVTSAAKSQASIIDAAITTGDNVRLMSEVIALARIEGVASVFILDSSHNLIASSDRLERSNLELENAIENALLRTKSNGAEMAQEILPEAEAAAPESAQNSNVQTQENAAQQPGAYSENALATGQVQPANITNTQEAAQAAEVPQEAPPSKTKRAVVPTAILYSLPLGADNMLFVEISLQDVTTLSAHWRNWYYYPIFGLAVILLIIVFYIFASLIIGIPFRRLNKKLEKAEKIIALSKESANAAQTPPAESEQTSKEEPAVEPMSDEEPAPAQFIQTPQLNEPETQDEKEDAEFTEITSQEGGQTGDAKYLEMTNLFLKENKKKVAIINSLEAKTKSLAALLDFCVKDYVNIKNENVYIVCDNENKIVFAIDKTKTILKKDFEPESHIADACLAAEITELIAKAQETPNTAKRENVANIELNFLCIAAKGQILGTIIYDLK